MIYNTVEHRQSERKHKQFAERCEPRPGAVSGSAIPPCLPRSSYARQTAIVPTEVLIAACEQVRSMRRVGTLFGDA